MVFNSLAFLIFFMLFFVLYWKLFSKYNIQIRNAFILLASYIFYGWWDWTFLGLIIISTLIDFILGKRIYASENNTHKKWLLGLSVLSNLGILFFFKYFNFFIDSLQTALATISVSTHVSTLDIILPVGISFYTFQTLSYTIDIYRGTLKPTKHILQFAAFVSFFPQLVAGPIERASHLLPQFTTSKAFNYKLAISGLRLVLWGFFKKLVIADNFGILTDLIFEKGVNASGIGILIGTFCFALQIYADFSGYSDMAIGFSRMLGFDLMKNFSTPYFAKSFSEFWKRWHISLSTWFRDYVYIPLGGNRKNGLKTSTNLLVTFLVSGLWHGASFTFIIWGALHGFALIIEKYIAPKSKIYRVIAMGCILLFWLPFRAESIEQLMTFTQALFQFKSYDFTVLNQIIVTFSESRFYSLLAVTGLFLLVEYKMQFADINEWLNKQSTGLRYTFYYIVILSVFIIGNFSVKPNFIYFQF